MPFARPVVQQAGTPDWRLAGSIATPTDLLPTSRSLTLTRRTDEFSSYLKFAMSAHSILPVLKIHTPDGLATVVDAKIVSILRPAGGRTSKGSGRSDTSELEEIKITFQKITYTWKGGNKSSQDDWDAGG